MNTLSYETHPSHSFLGSLGSAGRSIVLLLVRLAFGFESFQSGYGHLHSVPAMVARFQKWGVPFPHANVYISGVTEMIGGILLMAGLFSRVISIPLIFNFIVAIFTPHSYVSTLMKAPGVAENWTNIVDDTAFPFLIASLVILAFGPGRVSMDYLLQRTILRNVCPARHLVLETKAQPMRAVDG